MLDENKAINTKCSWEMKKKSKIRKFFQILYIYLYSKSAT